MTIACSSIEHLDKGALRRWKNLAVTLGVNPSLFPDWTQLVIDSHCAERDIYYIEKKETDENSLFFCVFTITNVKHLLKPTQALPVSSLVSYHSEFLTLLPAEETLDIFTSCLVDLNVTAASLGNMIIDTTVAKYLSGTSQTSHWFVLSENGDTSPYLPLDTSWDELVSQKSKKFRYKLRKRSNEFESSPSLRMEWMNTTESISSLRSSIIWIERNSWKSDSGHAIYDSNTESTYFDSLLKLLASTKRLLANVLFFEETPIAYNICCIERGWAGQLKTSFDYRYKSYSPGQLVIDHAIRESIFRGAREFDFLGDSDPHKLSWTKQVRQHRNFFLYKRGRPVSTANYLRKRLSSR